MQYTINNSYNSTYILKLWNDISKHNIIIDRWADLLSYEAMSMNDHDEKLLKEKIKENERRGRVLSLLSISPNFFSVLIVLGAGLLNEGIISLILCIFGAIILPLAGFIYAIIIHKKFFYYFEAPFVISFIINLIIYLAYLFCVSIWCFFVYIIWIPW